MFKRKLRFFLHRWHRRLGVSAAIIIVLVSITGLMLNHTGQLELAKHYPQSSIWLWPYPAEANVGLTLQDQVIYQTSDAVYLNDQALLSCEPPLINAAMVNHQLWVLCKQQILLLENGQLIESIDSRLLGNHIENLAHHNEQLLIQQAGIWFGFDDISMMLTQALPAPESITQPSVLDHAQQTNRTISLQKVVLDLHSGRFFGELGVYIVDAAAVILLLLSLSGFWIWYSRLK